MHSKSQARQNKLIVIEGLPCAGKTILVRKIKENLDYGVVLKFQNYYLKMNFFRATVLI